MLRAVKVALDPTPRQARQLESHAGAARFAYNAALTHVRRQIGGFIGGLDFSYYALRRWWNEWKGELAPWWPQNGKEAYNTGLEALGAALSNWKKSKDGKRKGRRVGFPKYKSKSGSAPKVAFTTGFKQPSACDPNSVRLPRIGRVHTMENVAGRVGAGHVTRITVSHHAGRWMAALTVDDTAMAQAAPKPSRRWVGVDLGVRTLATLSDGTVIANPRNTKRGERRLRHASRALSRKTVGSARWRKAKRKVQRVHAHMADSRMDALNKLTHMLATRYSDICIEDLNVAGMVRNRSLAKAVSDCGFAELRRQLAYKTVRHGSRLHVIDRYHPSSKTCSACGAVKAKLSLAERTYACAECGLVLDRDLNAAVNIERYAARSAREALNARGTDTRPATASSGRQTVMKREPSSPPGVRLGAGSRKAPMSTRTN
ncbi:IS607 family element RNA-guided endonuclease TnpB [Bifidobacterium gallicum]|uniref:Transposase n=1 Tax=Bifidobacterium gallicum DSM 20093 = LMG 11596 TaxID=561180 RepID=D1NTD6_9BIFI|nr:IS607 family element RNA-guided endonuclease TnpB [Bifidobacterium gallicum]EFA22990.1 transposase, IS605 OrfB family [Bifidobacterium gallicum DSM 20093 = LMG 11596]KFI57692.1 transposase [Bifidobacterium gallicum DSM 20093 = LMG 11596]